MMIKEKEKREKEKKEWRDYIRVNREIKTTAKREITSFEEKGKERSKTAGITLLTSGKKGGIRIRMAGCSSTARVSEEKGRGNF